MIKKILLADNERVVRSIVAATVKDDSKYELLEARDGEEALEVTRRERPDLILLDVMMPGMTGFEVCRMLKANPNTRQIHVIMLTALAQESEKEKGREAGADGYISKPFSPTALLRKIEETLGK